MRNNGVERMIKKRFKETVSTGIVTDIVTGKEYNCDMRIDEDLLELMNTLDEENTLLKEQFFLLHMQSMFSTVKSFKGDVSKRYYYSEENDTIYDTANNYGQYDKVVEKKELAMLLNEYETLLKEAEGDNND